MEKRIRCSHWCCPLQIWAAAASCPEAPHMPRVPGKPAPGMGKPPGGSGTEPAAGSEAGGGAAPPAASSCCMMVGPRGSGSGGACAEGEGAGARRVGGQSGRHPPRQPGRVRPASPATFCNTPRLTTAPGTNGRKQLPPHPEGRSIVLGALDLQGVAAEGDAVQLQRRRGVGNIAARTREQWCASGRASRAKGAVAQGLAAPSC